VDRPRCCWACFVTKKWVWSLSTRHPAAIGHIPATIHALMGAAGMQRSLPLLLRYLNSQQTTTDILISFCLVSTSNSLSYFFSKRFSLYFCYWWWWCPGCQYSSYENEDHYKETAALRNQEMSMKSIYSTYINYRAYSSNRACTMVPFTPTYPWGPRPLMLSGMQSSLPLLLRYLNSQQTTTDILI